MPKVYDNKLLLHQLYIGKKMTIDQIAVYFLKQYNIEVTPMTIWNHLKKYDLLKAAGKGRNLGKRTQGGTKRAGTNVAAPKKTPRRPGSGGVFF